MWPASANTTISLWANDLYDQLKGNFNSLDNHWITYYQVGDPKQLPATVISTVAQDAG